MPEGHVVAIDLGASSGRVTKVQFDGERFESEEVHRFQNTPIQTNGTLQWDILSLWHEITEGIDKVTRNAMSVGIDTWGVDYALLDRDGNLLTNPVHYRDPRTEGVMEWVFERVPRREIFKRTGIQFMPFNTLYQLASLIRSGSPLLGIAATYLGIPDLINYWLSGDSGCEFTHATTTQFLNPRTGDWDMETLSEIGFPTEIFPKIVQPGTRYDEFKGFPVIATACHDTASAVVSVPTTTEDYAYLSSGTWSLIGMEVGKPLISDASYRANVTNEGGVEGTFRLLKNVMGLWLEQECMNTWSAEGTAYSFERIISEANSARPFRSLINPDDQAFLAPGDMPARIREFCEKTGQPTPATVGQIVRTIYESLALRYRDVLDTLIELTGRRVDRLHIIGGGSQNPLLCQLTADSIGRPVMAGPVEATTLGNAIVQMIALGEMDDLKHAREILNETLETRVYEPVDHEGWEEPYRLFKSVSSQ